MNTKPTDTVLIISKQDKTQQKLEDILKDFNLSHLTIKTIDSIKNYHEKDFLFILFNHELVDINYTNIIRDLQQLKQTKTLPILFLSSTYPEELQLTESSKSIIFDFIQMPLNKNLLKIKINLFRLICYQHILLQKEIEEKKKAKEALETTKNELLKSKEKAEESDRMKSEFLANMSHEIRTPLNAIVGFAELFAKEDLSHDTKEIYRRYINRSSNLLLNLINDIIDVAKIEAGKISIECKFENIIEILDELEITTQNNINQRMKKNLIVVKKINDNEKEILLYIDDNRFRQIFNNLLSNAVKYTTEGVIEYGIYKKDEKKITFYVKDSGVGIPKNKLTTIFERFEQGKVHEHLQVESTGLGLFISKILVEKMNGQIWAESIERKGSTFYFTLPVREVPEQVVDIPVHELIQPKTPVWKLKDLHILIVEDEPINFMLLNEILVKRKIRTTWAKNGMQAVNFLKNENNFDAVLMDIKMPVLSGYDAIKELREMKVKIPIIAQTAYAMREDKKNALKGGFDDYVSKPIKSDVLMDKLNRLIKV